MSHAICARKMNNLTIDLGTTDVLVRWEDEFIATRRFDQIRGVHCEYWWTIDVLVEAKVESRAWVVRSANGQAAFSGVHLGLCIAFLTPINAPGGTSISFRSQDVK
jgi:hypothetical protein